MARDFEWLTIKKIILLGEYNMKKFTKLVLVSSLAISANAMAMQAMDDASLGATTGQDGINIGIGISKIEIEKLLIHDNDGLAAGSLVAGQAGFGGTATAGAIVIKGNGKANDINQNKGIVIGANYASLLPTNNLIDLQIDSDAGAGGGNTAFINIAAQVSGLDINIGEIGVTASKTAPATGATSIRRGGDDANYNAILSGLAIKTGKMNANIQLGAAPQGAMIKLDTVMQGGLEIKSLGILDNSTKTATRASGEIFVESIKIADANSTDFTIKQNISVVGKEGANNGYIRMVSTAGAMDTYVKGIHLGSREASSIGDMEVQGLQTYFSPAAGAYLPGSIITISGR